MKHLSDSSALHTSTAATVANELSAIAADAGHIVAMFQENGLQAAGRLAKEAVRPLAPLASGCIDAAVKGRQGIAAADRMVHDKPWQAVGTGVAAGLLFGLAAAYLTSRR